MAGARQLTNGWGKTKKRLLPKKEWLEHDNWQVDGERQKNAYYQGKNGWSTIIDKFIIIYY